MPCSAFSEQARSAFSLPSQPGPPEWQQVGKCFGKVLQLLPTSPQPAVSPAESPTVRQGVKGVSHDECTARCPGGRPVGRERIVLKPTSPGFLDACPSSEIPPFLSLELKMFGCRQNSVACSLCNLRCLVARGNHFAGNFSCLGLKVDRLVHAHI